MKNNFIFLSNSTGGIKTFEEILIKYVSKKKLSCNLIGKNIKNKSNKNLNFNSYTLSNTVATPCPKPIHIVATPNVESCSRIS